MNRLVPNIFCLSALAGVAYLAGTQQARGQIQPPGGLPCYTFDNEHVACSACTPVNNCGDCSGGSCGAIFYVVCKTTFDATPVPGAGNFRNWLRTKCKTRFSCVVPNPCSGPCILGTVSLGDYGNNVIIERPGNPCGEV